MKPKIKRTIKYIALSLLVVVLLVLLISSFGIGGNDCKDVNARLSALESDVNDLDGYLRNLGKDFDNLEDAADVSLYIGTWYFPEPLVDFTMLKAGGYYDFSFSCYINGSAETRNYSRLYYYTVKENATEYDLLKYCKADGTDTVAYRSKYGEFSANSYQTITINSEPPDEIKAFLDANAVYVGRVDAQVIIDYQSTIAALEERLAALEGAE